jgi:5'(3')-deoxyribonucleotidase
VKGVGVQVENKFAEDKLKVGIDIDDTCWDLMSHWLDAYNKITNEQVKPKDIHSWEIDEYVLDSKWLWYVLKQPEFWHTIKTPPKTQIKSIKWIYDNFDTYFITDTNYKIPRDKFDKFFEIYDFVSLDKLIICKNKGMVKVDILIDDNPHTIENANIPIKIMLDKPWNQDKMLDFHRVKNWNTLIDRMKEYLKFYKN